MKTRQDLVNHWNKTAKEALVGKTIKDAAYVPDEEFGYVFCITLDDGTKIFPMADDEGNGPGSLQLEGNKTTCLPTI